MDINTNRNKAIMFMVLAAVLWSTGGLFVKLIPWNPLAIYGGRAMIANIVILAYMIYDHKKPKSKEKQQPFLTLNLHTFLGGLAYSSLSLFYISATKIYNCCKCNCASVYGTYMDYSILIDVFKEKTNK